MSGERRAVPITESRMAKGGLNEPRGDKPRPPAPQGSGGEIMMLPPNPYYHGEWAVTVEGGTAKLILPMPGGKIANADAESIIEWLDLVIRQLRRHSTPNPEDPQP